MSNITASMVKELREKTGAGMMDCKTALAETSGDMDAAVDWLRSKGLSKAAKKSGRTAAEGLVSVMTSDDQKSAVVVEINSETDFVSRNEEFQNFVRTATQVALDEGANSLEEFAGIDFGNGKNVSDSLTDLVATIGENMQLRRATTHEVSDGVVASYVHNSVVEGMGKIGVLVALESTGDKTVLADLGKKIAMHVAAAHPEFLSVDSVSQDALDRERTVLTEQARESGKPEEIIEKMVEGRIRKYYEEVVLLEQVFVMDGETKISKVVEQASKDAGADVKLVGFTKFVLGEGIEKEEEDFAAEVMKTASNG
jgi:elongation factor Ts